MCDPRDLSTRAFPMGQFPMPRKLAFTREVGSDADSFCCSACHEFMAAGCKVTSLQDGTYHWFCAQCVESMAVALGIT